jgi:hypothetical protein
MSGIGLRSRSRMREAVSTGLGTAKAASEFSVADLQAALGGAAVVTCASRPARTARGRTTAARTRAGDQVDGSASTRADGELVAVHDIRHLQAHRTALEHHAANDAIRALVARKDGRMTGWIACGRGLAEGTGPDAGRIALGRAGDGQDPARRQSSRRCAEPQAPISFRLNTRSASHTSATSSVSTDPPTNTPLRYSGVLRNR